MTLLKVISVLIIRKLPLGLQKIRISRLVANKRFLVSLQKYPSPCLILEIHVGLSRGYIKFILEMEVFMLMSLEDTSVGGSYGHDYAIS